MEKPIEYPEDFEQAVIAVFPDDEGVKVLLDFGSWRIKTLLEVCAESNRLSFSASQVHKALNEGNETLLDAIKRDAEEVNRFVELLERWEKIYMKHLLSVAQEA